MRGDEIKKLRLKITTVVAFTLITVQLFVTGCASKSGKLPTYMHPEHLYLNAKSYKQIYVELDIVEGASLPTGFTDTLYRFLNAHCHKPGGIKIIQGKPIPISKFEGFPKRCAPLLCINGPGQMNQGDAYIHILCYDSDKGHWDERKHEPYAIIEGSHISIDLGYVGGGFENYILQHELGHILGLCKNTTHGDGAHCNNHGCLMEPSPTLLNQTKWVAGHIPKAELCSSCLRDLNLERNKKVDTVYFQGPFLVREQNSYAIAMLGGACRIFIPKETLKNFKWDKLLSGIQKTIMPGLKVSGGKWDEEGVIWLVARGPDSKLIQAALNDAAQSDPDPYIRNNATKELRKIK